LAGKLNRMSVEPITATAPRKVRRAVLTQWWRDLAFLHWAVPPAVVAPLLPAGTRPDLLDGVTYVGLIGFEMDRVGPGFGVPYFGRFPETNIRLYSVDDEGRRGVVFRSLDAARLLPVSIGRGIGLNYVWAKMRIDRLPDGSYRYRNQRRSSTGARSEFTVKPGEEAEKTALNDFLTARWGLHARLFGRTYYLPNEHPTWQLHEATLTNLNESLIAAAGLPAPTTPPASVLWSPGVPVRFGPPKTRPRVGLRAQPQPQREFPHKHR
jgi:uncharacterized protein YqjF (DUF2071 family)